MNPDPPWLLSYCAGSGGIAGITENQQVMPGRLNLLSEVQVPSGVASKPIFSIATLKKGFGLPFLRGTGRPSSSAFLSKAYSCAPLNPPPPTPGVTCGNSS